MYKENNEREKGVGEMDPVDVKGLEIWNTSISMLWGKSPKAKMFCGKCSYYFKKRFDMVEIRKRNPKVICPACQTVNVVPIYTS